MTVRKMTFRNRDKNKDKINALAQALNGKSNTTFNMSTPMAGGSGESEDDIWGGASEGAKGLFNLAKGIKNSGLFSNGGGESGLSAVGTAADSYISGGGGSNLGLVGNAANNYISTGASTSGSAIGNAIGSEVGSGLGSSASSIGGAEAAGGASGGGGFGGGVPWAMIANVSKGIYNNISNKTPEDYSDTEQAVIYPLQGAANGSMFGPWGALGGALYGLGYAFKDDMGLKDSNFFTQMTFPIGMGDGGGLRINGEPILDIL